MTRTAAAMTLSAILSGHAAFAAEQASARLASVEALAAASASAAGDMAATSAARMAGDVDWSMPPVQIGASPRGALLPALYVSFAALQVVDGYTTSNGLRRGAVEGNGLMSGAAGNPVALWGVKAGITAGSILLAERLWKTHHRAEAIATMVVSNAVMSAVAVHNSSTLRSLR